MSIVSSIAPTGVIFPFAGDTAPTDWLLCHGQAISRTDYASLYDVIGTQYGSGDGNTTFNVPDLRYQFLRGYAPQLSLTGDGSTASPFFSVSTPTVGVLANLTFILNNHGLTNGSIIQFQTINYVTGISNNTNYYVINATTNNFQISTTFNGSIVQGTRTSNVFNTWTVKSKNIVKFTSHGINRTGLKVRVTTLGSLTGLAVSTDYYAVVINENYLAFTTDYTQSINDKLSATTLQTIGGTTTSTIIIQYEDPDYATRNKAASGGNTSGIGTRQEDQFQSHTHTVAAGSNDAAGTITADGTTTNYNVTSSATGGNETRPTNIYINYIIKI